jgi:hypothetical protein
VREREREVRLRERPRAAAVGVGVFVGHLLQVRKPVVLRQDRVAEQGFIVHGATRRERGRWRRER